MPGRRLRRPVALAAVWRRAVDLLVRGVTGLGRAAAGPLLTVRAAATARPAWARDRVCSLARLCGARRGC